MSPSKIKDYTLDQKLGQGNMGIVYLSRRSDGVFDKKVAIKFIRPDRLDPKTSQRFLREQKILANFDHPTFTRLYDTGFDQHRQSPYLVMEYIDGVDIATFCQRQQLSVRDKLELFLQLANGISFAHRNLVIHRDLKPSNILVSKENQVKILDFGIAKRLGDEGLDITETKGNPLTPKYASPEQIEGKRLTTSSDLYSLGVILYEMLTSQTPYGNVTTEFELGEAIRTRDPLAPSLAVLRTKVEAWDETLPSSQLPQEMDDVGLVKRSISRQLKGDLDTIVLKFLQKEPQRRYDSVDELTADLDRYLQRKPVKARKNSFFYKARKTIQRNKLVSLGIVSMIISILASLVIVKRDLDRTEKMLKASEESQQFLQSIFRPLNPYTIEGNQEIPAKTLILEKASIIENHFEEQPILRANMMISLANILQVLEQYQEAERLAAKAIEILKENRGHDESLAKGFIQRARINYKQAKYEPALDQIKQAEAIITQENFEASCIPCLKIWLIRTYAGIYWRTSRYQDGIDITKKGLEILETYPTDATQDEVILRNLLALNYENLRIFDQSISNYEKAIVLNQQSTKVDVVKLVDSYSGLGSIYIKQKKYPEAIKHYQSAIDTTIEKFGENSSQLGTFYSQLSTIYTNQNELEKAEGLLNKALKIEKKVFGERHTKIAIRYNNLANILRIQGKYKEAIELLEKSLSINLEKLGTEDAEVGTNYFNLARNYIGLQDWLKAQSYFEQALKVDIVVFGRISQEVAVDYAFLGQISERLDRREQAFSSFEKAITILRQIPNPPSTLLKKYEERLEQLQSH